MDDDKDLPEPEDIELEGDGEVDVPDDESDAAEGEDTADDVDEGEDEGEQGNQGQPKSRANSRIRALKQREKEAVERAEKTERDLAALRYQMEQVQRSVHTSNSTKDAEAEAELLAQMDPVQRVQYGADKKINAVHGELRKLQITALDSSDKATFLAKAQNDPSRARLSDEVEKNLSDMRSKGLNAPREDIYYYLLGKSLEERKAKSGGKSPERTAASARINLTRGRSTSARSDASSGRKGRTSEEHLAEVLI